MGIDNKNDNRTLDEIIQMYSNKTDNMIPREEVEDKLPEKDTLRNAYNKAEDKFNKMSANEKLNLINRIRNDRTDFLVSYKGESFDDIVRNDRAAMNSTYFDTKDETVKYHRKSQEALMIESRQKRDPDGKSRRTQFLWDVESLLADKKMNPDEKARAMRMLLEDYADKFEMDSGMQIKDLDDVFEVNSTKALLSDVIKYSEDAKQHIAKVTGKDPKEFITVASFNEVKSTYDKNMISAVCQDMKDALFVLNVKYAFTSPYNRDEAQRRMAQRVFGDPAVERVLAQRYADTIQQDIRVLHSEYGSDKRLGDYIHRELADDLDIPYGDDHMRYIEPMMMNGTMSFTVGGFEQAKENYTYDLQKEKELSYRRDTPPSAGAANLVYRELEQEQGWVRRQRPLPEIEHDDDEPELDF